MNSILRRVQSIRTIILIGTSLIPTLLGMGYLLCALCQKFRTYIKKQKKIKSDITEKRKLRFYNIWLPCVILICIQSLIAMFVCCWMQNDFNYLFVVFVLGFAFGIFMLFYQLVYFLYTRITYRKCYITKKYFWRWFTFYLLLYGFIVGSKIYDYYCRYTVNDDLNKPSKISGRDITVNMDDGSVPDFGGVY